jgi:nicotinamide-nucleotide amidase
MDTEIKELMLRAPRLTLAVAESVTCGLVQARVGSISGASEFFLGGITTYTLEQKLKHLGVDRAQAEPVNAVSAAVASQMACGVSLLFGAAVGVATTGYAEPVSARGVRVPFAWWGIARRSADGGHLVQTGRFEATEEATRIEAQSAIAEAAVTALLRQLREIRAPVTASPFP